MFINMLFLLSPNEAKVSDKSEVQPYVFGLAPTGLECRVVGTSGSSFGHHQTFTLSIQVALEGECMKTLISRRNVLIPQWGNI